MIPIKARRERGMPESLSTKEKGDLSTLEVIIGQGMKSFMEVGKALLTIREQRLYREEFKTFDAYCAERWGMGKQHANRLISGSQVAANLVASHDALCTPCEIQPTSEYQLRPLAVLAPKRQREVWEEAVKTAPTGGGPSYKNVRAKVIEAIGPYPPAPPKEKDPYPESDAHYYVTIALVQLGKIQMDDGRRLEALARITAWMEKNNRQIKRRPRKQDHGTT
jgi:hypothetical protein